MVMERHISGAEIFKRDSTGKIRVWWFDIGTDGEKWGWRTNAGIRGGKIVTSSWTVVEQKNVGKANETTLKDQAFAEAHADMAKKLDRGYFTSIHDVGSFEKIKPMLAIEFAKAKLNLDEVTHYSQPKLDGIRCIARKDGLWTRSGKKIESVPHIERSLKPLFDESPDCILDGELYNHQLKDNFNKITSIVRKQKPTAEDLVESEKYAQYHVYDCVRIPGHSNAAVFSDRFFWFCDRKPIEYVYPVSTTKLTSLEQMNQIYMTYLERGFEGQMIRVNQPYQQNKRSKCLIKRKEFFTDEFDVISVEEGKGNWSGYVKRFVLRLSDGTEFGAGVRGEQDVLRKLHESQMTPTWATVRYFTPTPDGIPRFPVVVDWGMGERND